MGLLGLGLFLSFRIMNTTDMTVEGTFPFRRGRFRQPDRARDQPLFSYFGRLCGGGFSRPGHGPFDHQG